MTPNEYPACFRCERELKSARSQMGSLQVDISSPIQALSCPPCLLCVLCGMELGEWLNPQLTSEPSWRATKQALRAKIQSEEY